MAVVLQTEHGLFGWHVCGLGNIEQRAPRLRDFIASHRVAAGLGFTGPVVGFDLGR